MKQLMISRFIRVRRMHAKEECHNCRPTNTAGDDCHWKSESYRILWVEESINASRMVSCGRTVPVTICLKTHCEEKVALGALSAWWFINWICCGSSFRVQHARHWNGHDRVAHYACKPRSAVCVETYSWTGTNGRHFQLEQDFRLRGRHGMYARVT